MGREPIAALVASSPAVKVPVVARSVPAGVRRAAVSTARKAGARAVQSSAPTSVLISAATAALAVRRRAVKDA